MHALVEVCEGGQRPKRSACAPRGERSALRRTAKLGSIGGQGGGEGGSEGTENVRNRGGDCCRAGSQGEEGAVR